MQTNLLQRALATVPWGCLRNIRLLVASIPEKAHKLRKILIIWLFYRVDNGRTFINCHVVVLGERVHEEDKEEDGDRAEGAMHKGAMNMHVPPCRPRSFYGPRLCSLSMR